MINTSIGLLGVARQADKSTAAVAPRYKHGLTGGGLIKPDRKVEQKSVACGLRADVSNGAYVSEVNMAVDFETLAYADVLGLYALAAMGNVVSTAATQTGYYKHVITLGSALPLLTFWGQVGNTADTTVHEAVGCKVDTLSLDFEGNAPLDIGVTAAGIDSELFGSWSGDAEPSCFEGYFVPTNGSFRISTNDQAPAEAIVTKGGFELSNNLTTYRSAGNVVAAEVSEGKLTTSVKMTVMPEDWTPIRKVLTGTETGTKVTSNVVYGSASWAFTHSQDANCTMQVDFANVPWNCKTPEIDPEGSAAEVEFSADNVGNRLEDGHAGHHHHHQQGRQLQRLGGIDAQVLAQVHGGREGRRVRERPIVPLEVAGLRCGPPGVTVQAGQDRLRMGVLRGEAGR